MADGLTGLSLNIGGANFTLPAPKSVTEVTGKASNIFESAKAGLQGISNFFAGAEAVSKGQLTINVGQPQVNLEKPQITLPAGEVLKRITPYLIGAVALIIVVIVMLKR